MDHQQNKIKVAVITGFLGVGKTTFINQLLKNTPEIKFALVENEFGAVSIDTKLITGVDASHMFELKQGCICCTISDQYELVLQELAERFQNVEHLLIETTGIADPASVIRPFFADEVLKEIYHYNGTICLIDALNFENSPEKEIAIKQIVVADLVLISKAENLSEIQRETFTGIIQKINPFAKIKYFTLDSRKNIQLNNILQRKRTELDFVGFSNSHANLSTKALHFYQALNKDEFIHWLSYNLDIYKTQIYRTKGILCFENEPYEFILQGVGGGFELAESDFIFADAKSEVVFIGKLDGLDLNFE